MQPTDAATAAWRGNAPLWRVFWLYNVLATVVLGIGLDLIAPSAGLRWVLGVAVGLPFMTWALVSLWRCATNTTRPIFGHLARLHVILTVLALLFVRVGEPLV